MLGNLISDWAVWSKAPLDMNAEIHNFRKLRDKGNAEIGIEKTGFTDGNDAREPPTLGSDLDDIISDIDRQLMKHFRQGFRIVVFVGFWSMIVAVCWEIFGHFFGVIFADIAPTFSIADCATEVVGCLFATAILLCVGRLIDCE